MLPSDTASGHAEHREVPTESVSLRALSLPARLVISVAIGGIAAYAVFHLAMVFLFVAPSNTLREENWDRVRGYIYPEFEQNWKLFAPNPLQRNEAVHVRAEVRDPDGGRHVTDWIDLTEFDIDGIEHNLLPSHTAQNQLRRAWDFYEGAHDDEGDPIGVRGEVSARFVHRIALLRLSESMDGMDADTIERIQLRSAVTRLPAPSWRPEDFDTSTAYEEQDWWVVTTEDLPRGAPAREGE